MLPLLRLFTASLDLQDEKADGFFEVGLALYRVVAMMIYQQILLQLSLPLEEQVKGDPW